MAGNATITLYDGTRTVDFEVWIQNFSTATTNEFASAQVLKGISWMPIRRAEVSVQFTIIWPLVGTGSIKQAGFEAFDPADGFGKMQYFQDVIRSHQLSLVTGGTNTPMVFNYLNNSDKSSPIYNELVSKQPLSALNYTGWIQQIEKNYIRFQNVYITNYNMTVINKNSQNPSTPSYQNSNTAPVTSVTYTPTLATQASYGSNWVNITTLASGTSYIQGLPN